MNLPRRKRAFSQRGRFSGNRTGAAIIELAILMPFLFLLVVGIFEIGSALKTKSSLTLVCRSICGLACKPDARNEKILTEAKRLLSEANLPAGQAEIRIFVNDQPGETALALRNDKIKISVSVPNKTMFPISSGFFGGGPAECQESMVMCKQ